MQYKNAENWLKSRRHEFKSFDQRERCGTNKKNKSHNRYIAQSIEIKQVPLSVCFINPLKNDISSEQNKVNSEQNKVNSEQNIDFAEWVAKIKLQYANKYLIKESIIGNKVNIWHCEKNQEENGFIWGMSQVDMFAYPSFHFDFFIGTFYGCYEKFKSLGE